MCTHSCIISLAVSLSFIVKYMVALFALLSGCSTEICLMQKTEANFTSFLHVWIPDNITCKLLYSSVLSNYIILERTSKWFWNSQLSLYHRTVMAKLYKGSRMFTVMDYTSPAKWCSMYWNKWSDVVTLWKLEFFTKKSQV